MDKKAADTIIKGCNKYGLFSSIRRQGDEYFIVFLERLEIMDFEAAKLIANGLILNTRAKVKEQNKVHNPDISYLRPRWGHKKQKNSTPGAWGEKRLNVSEE